MKYGFPLLLLSLFSLRINAQTPAMPPADSTVQDAGLPATTIAYEEEEINFGKVREGKIVEKTFWFSNAGTTPLLIENVRSSCGCTVTEWPKEPIPPGGRGKIVLHFNTKGKLGAQIKRVTVVANTVPHETFLQLRGEVKRRR